jgi:hypothetical protein
MRVINKPELHEYGVAKLGLEPSACDLTAIEAIACALRRAAGFLCPCSRRTLIRAILKPLDALVDDAANLAESVENTLEALISYGDLLEEHEIAGSQQENRSTLLYSAPPSFIWRDNHSAFLLGIVPDYLSSLPKELEGRIEYVNHVRRIQERGDDEDLRRYLRQFGLVELSADKWMKAPQHESADDHLRRINRGLIAISGDLPGLTLLNPDRAVRYYRGRWQTATNQSGCFVARRSQLYGNDIWCYVELTNGRPERMIEFPSLGSRMRGCDEAWRLQAAIDANRGFPQQFRIRSRPSKNMKFIDFFSPIPMWARRRFDAVGEPVSSDRCLFSYAFRTSDVAEETAFIQKELWLAPIDSEEV